MKKINVEAYEVDPLDFPEPIGSNPSALKNDFRDFPVSVLSFDDNATHPENCVKCGSRDIVPSNRFALVCRNCRYSWVEPPVSSLHPMGGDLDTISGKWISEGSMKETSDNSVLVAECPYCGAEIASIDQDVSSVRCHWCRTFLPAESFHGVREPHLDSIIPFKVSRHDAVDIMKNFVSSYDSSNISAESIHTNDVIGTFLPYYVYDLRASSVLTGKRAPLLCNEINATTIQAFVSHSHFSAEDLMIEASGRRSVMWDNNEDNYIINCVMPYDVSEAVRFHPGYVRGSGINTERRTISEDDARKMMEDRALGVSMRYIRAFPYSSAHRFLEESLRLHGYRVITTYCPAWIYAYTDESNGRIRYIAVNGQTGKVSGSISINPKKFRRRSSQDREKTVLKGFLVSVSALLLLSLFMLLLSTSA